MIKSNHQKTSAQINMQLSDTTTESVRNIIRQVLLPVVCLRNFQSLIEMIFKNSSLFKQTWYSHSPLYEAEADYSVSARRAVSHLYFSGYSFHGVSFSPLILWCRFGGQRGEPAAGSPPGWTHTHLQHICAHEFGRSATHHSFGWYDFAMATVTYSGRVVGQGCVAPVQVFGLSEFCCIDSDYLILICLLFQQCYRSEILDQRLSSIKSQEIILDLRISSKMYFSLLQRQNNTIRFKTVSWFLTAKRDDFFSNWLNDRRPK